MTQKKHTPEKVVEVTYRDGANYKTQYIFKLPEGAKFKPGDEVPSTVFGISKEDWFSDYLPKGYDKEIDHNELEIVKVRNKARHDVLSERFKTGGMLLPDNIDAAITKLKTALIKKAQSKGISENFGQKEVRMLEDKFGFNSKVGEFDNWASEYSFGKGGKTTSTGYRADVGGIRENSWSSNGIEYATKEEAEKALNSLADRWFGFDISRIVPIDTPKNEAIDPKDPSIFQNYRSSSSYAQGGTLSNKESIHNLQFEDDTDSRHGKYNFSFITKDAEGNDIGDFDGYIIESPPSSRMDDEFEWSQDPPEDWEGAEKFISDSFYDWKQQQTSKQKRFADGGNAEGGSNDKKIRFDMYGYIKSRTQRVQDGDTIIRVSNQAEAEQKAKEFLETNGYHFVELHHMGDLIGYISKSGTFKWMEAPKEQIFRSEKFATGGQLFKHKHVDATAKILEQTNKGYKVEFTDNSAKKPKAKIKFFNKIDFDKDKGLFELVKEEVEIPKVDLFEHPELIPEPVSEILNRFQEESDGDELSYENLRLMLDAVHNEGYTFEYGLDAVPYGLRPVHVALEELEDGYVEVEDTNAFAEGGKVNGAKTLTKGNSSRYYIANFLSSGTVGSYTGLWTYKDIDAVKSIAINILDEEGDVEYSIFGLKKVLNEAVLRYKGGKPISENADDYWQWVNTDSKEGPYIYKNRDREISIQGHPTKAWLFITEILKGSVTEKERDNLVDNFVETGLDQHEFKGGFYEAILKIPVEYHKSKERDMSYGEGGNPWAVTKYCIKKDGQYLTRKSLTSSLVFTDNPEFRYTWPESEKESAQKLAKQFNATLVPDKEHAMYAEGGSVDSRKSGNVPAIEKRVAEINELINRANENDLRIIDESTTWQAPMKYKPIKYSNGTLYLEYQILDLYNHNKGLGSNWETKKDTVKKSNTRDQLLELRGISRLYKKALKHFDTYGYGRYAKGGGIVEKAKTLRDAFHLMQSKNIFLSFDGENPKWENTNKYNNGVNHSSGQYWTQEDVNKLVERLNKDKVSKQTIIDYINARYGEATATYWINNFNEAGQWAKGGKLNSNSKYTMKPNKKWAVTIMMPYPKTVKESRKVKVIELGPMSDEFDVRMAIERKKHGGDEDFINGQVLSVAEQHADGGPIDEQGYMVVGKKNGQLVEISENPMSKRNCEEFIYEQGIEKYYSDVDIIPYRGTKANFQYNSRPGTRFKFATGGNLNNHGMPKYKVDDILTTKEIIFDRGDYKGQIQYPSIIGKVTEVEPLGNDWVYTLVSSANKTHKVSENQISNKQMATGGNLDDLSPLEYFQALDFSTLPADFADFIKTDILTDPDLADLSPLEPAFIEIKEKIEKAHNVAAAVKPAEDAKPVETSEEDASRAETLEAISFLEILVEDQEGAEKEETLEAIGFLKELL